MQGIRGIVFDCDGVLFESRAANLAYYNAVLAEFGEPPVLPQERARAHLCHTAASPQVFATLLGAERSAEALALAARMDFRRFIPDMLPEPFLAETLAALAIRFPLAVATNRGNSMHEILVHFDLAHYFQSVVTSRDVLRPKPHPDMIHLAARRLGLQEGELLFIGDSELDREAAREAGVAFVAYRNDGLGEVSVASHRHLLRLLEGGRAGEIS
ncbi:MAG: hypothetical protein A2005_00935 [Desulfuromonadales bacterium GWC2_61_20]|nr:MAG: hypothetical protein A2005_00935 [Desulfuromonadales bacterium GWC2_61_20]HAD04960.1 HAD family hydrolase [Desulfuromonas sp.]HBT84236.1 HAD family hydrolase [Desulfuromonas sp.]